MAQSKIQFRQRGNVMQCRVRLADGRVIGGKAKLEPLSNAELGWFGSKAVRKTGGAIKKVAKVAHKVTHKGPIGKAHDAVQKAVGKYLPISKPFINIHNKLASPVHKVIEGKKVKAAVTAKAIVAVTKNLPPAKKALAQKALVLSSAAAEKKRDAAKVAALATVAAKLKTLQAPVPGMYVVKRPDGKVINVPAAKVR